jgi:nucleoside-diphosphate-sugar epimerase
MLSHLNLNVARERGVSAYVGDGRNRWSAVHRLDAARVYRLALEHGAPAKSRYHAVAEKGVSLKDIAEAIGRHLGVSVIGLSPDEAREHFGWFAMFAGMDTTASSTRTRESLGWEPKQPGLIADLEAGHYFTRPRPIAA